MEETLSQQSQVIELDIETRLDEQMNQQNVLKKEKYKNKSPQKKYAIWTKEENEILRQWVEKNGISSWTQISKILKSKTQKQCRDHWYYVMRSDIVKGNWTSQEDTILFQKYQEMGSKWLAIKKFFVNRSESCLKNRFYQTYRKVKKYITEPNIQIKTKDKNNQLLKLMLNFHKEKGSLNFYDRDKFFEPIKTTEKSLNFQSANVNLDSQTHQHVKKEEQSVAVILGKLAYEGKRKAETTIQPIWTFIEQIKHIENEFQTQVMDLSMKRTRLFNSLQQEFLNSSLVNSKTEQIASATYKIDQSSQNSMS